MTGKWKHKSCPTFSRQFWTAVFFNSQDYCWSNSTRATRWLL